MTRTPSCRDGTGRGGLSATEDLACGAAAGATARMAVAPLDVVKIRFQVQTETPGLYRYTSVASALRHIVSSEGPGALWKGNLPALLMVVPYASVQFTTFYQMQQAGGFGQLAEPYRSLAIGAVSGAFATTCTYPLDLLRTRLAAQTEPRVYKNMRHAVSTIYARHGIAGLYSGVGPTLVEIVPYVSIQFAIYETARARLVEIGRADSLSTIESLTIGASTGTFAKLVTLPLDNAKKRMQVQGQFSEAARGTASRQYTGMADVLTKVYAREGVRGLFRGVAPSLLKAAPNSAVTFAAYETARSFVLERRREKKREYNAT
jgi:solute carrier family 25 (mitochondrial thiamine pyrophosphate transporter), member 19